MINTLRNTPGLFITGTDTDVGKTIIAAGLVIALRKQGLDCGYFKPVASGAVKTGAGLMSPDLRLILNTTGLMDPPPLMNPICLVPPLAPLPAAEMTGVKWGWPEIARPYALLQSYHDFLVVEGVGGVLVPLKKKFLVIDLIKRLDLPVLVVARPNLGTINHTLLTLTVLKQHNVEVLGFLFNGQKDRPGLAEKTAPDIIRSFSGVPYWGSIPWDNKVSEEQFRLGSIPARSGKLLADNFRNFLGQIRNPKSTRLSLFDELKALSVSKGSSQAEIRNKFK
ncbi:MAG: dethiobiotin synthase [Deltaproteobacteria bacterium]|nr:dethiobiotin synthase [Deltaproteobacteria bacterium]